eukprot:g46537.t1
MENKDENFKLKMFNQELVLVSKRNVCWGFRRNQKMMFRQLKTCALFLDMVKNNGAKEIKESVQQQDIRCAFSCLGQKKLNETRQKWKSLKAECRVQDEELQNISTILWKFQALETKQQALREAKLQLEEALQQKKLQLQEFYETVRNQSGMKVLSVTENQIMLQFDPQALIPKTQLTPLVLTVTWTTDRRVKLEENTLYFNLHKQHFPFHFSQSNCAFLDLSEMDTVDLPNLTAEIWKRYMSQAELWGEIQHLQNRYAIDWLEDERKLKFLQLIAGSSSNVVCTLYVEHGYPGNGEVKLRSIQENNKPIDTVIK